MRDKLRSLSGFVAFCFLFAVPFSSFAAERLLGDVDNDGVVTVLDLVKLNNLSEKKQALDQTSEIFADMNGDGFVNEADRELMLRGILRSRDPESLPLATIRSTSPSRAETGVAVTRETILYFSIPLHPDTVLDTSKLYARFGDKKILSRVELASDRTKATLFMLEPLPPSSEIEVVFDSNGLKDVLNRPLDGDGDGEAGGTYAFLFRTLSIVPVANTGVVGRVLASEKDEGGKDVPIEGAIITVDGAEETLRAVTDADGNFTLSPAPAGIFFVHIDGREAKGSSFPDGDYYPFVGKKWFTEAGRADNPAGDADDTAEGGGTGVIYLPLVKADSLKEVSETQETVVTAPEGVAGMQGVELRVPANSLFADDGTRGGRVGIAPVEPGRIPSPLPPGLDLPLVITVQTDGPSNFDRPVPLKFPNLPDPVTGKKLGPGEKSALWSFSHDTGEWEVVGPMTVTEDGEFVVTDAGVGLLQPGWHGSQNGTSANPPIVTPPPPPPPSPSPTPTATPTPTPCPELGWNEYIKIGLEVANCGAQFTKKLQAIVSLVNLFKTGQGIYETVRKLLEVAKKPNLPIEEVKGILEAIKNVRQNIKEWSKGLLETLKQTGGPASLIDPILECASSGLEILNTICGGPIDNPDECKPTGWKKNVCDGIAWLKTIVGTVKQYKEYLENYTKELAGEAVAIGWDQALGEIILILEAANNAQNQFSKSRSVSSADVTYIKEEDRKAVVAKLQALLNSMSAIPKAAEASQDLLDSVNEAVEANFDVIESLNDGAMQTGSPAAGKTFYLLTYEDWEQRGVVPAGGRLSVVLPPKTSPITIEAYNPSSNAYGSVSFATDANGVPTKAPVIVLEPPMAGLPDTDGDGLIDRAERIVGTFPSNPDSDNDGINDYAELKAGTDPLGGRPSATGIIASAPTSGPAIDVSASDTFLAAALGANGVAVFDVSTPSAPVRLREIRTGGHVGSVAVLPGYVAAAAGSEGLAIIRLGRPEEIALSRKVAADNSSAIAVATDGATVFVGLSDGSIFAVDPATGAILGRQEADGNLQDLAFARDELYVRTSEGLEIFAFDSGDFTPRGKVALDSTAGAGGRRLRISVLDKTVLATNARGYQVVDVANASSPVVQGTYSDTQFGWKQIVANGSGLALAADAANSTDDGTHNVTLYSLSGGSASPQFVTRFETPGLAAALCIYNGLAYVADSASGVQVINYMAADNKGKPPTIALDSNFAIEEGVAEEGKRMRLTALVGDDVQVRNVEFFFNGARLVTDGNSLFETSFVTPLIKDSPTFKINVRAYDTGGNMAETGEIEIELVPDGTPPIVRQVIPESNALLRLEEVDDEPAVLRFSEPMNADTLSSGVRVLYAGPDRQIGTEDDVDLPYTGEYRAEINSLFLLADAPLLPGRYRFVVSAPAADLAGNTMEEFTSDFRIMSDVDTDKDGLPDDFEELLGTDPQDGDTDNDGVIDGAEDFDWDGLTNAQEYLIGTDPKDGDSDNDGLGDRYEDKDLDGLNNYDEFQAGTNPLLADTDGDGLDDASELAEGTDPKTKNPMTIRLASPDVSFLNALTERPDALQAHSAMVSYLNAVTVKADAGQLTLAAWSLPVSYRNDAAAEGGVFDDTAINVYSLPVSYLNATAVGTAASPAAAGASVAIYSRPVSYLNAAQTDPAPAYSILSLPVSYRNETP